jgi:hypothetical protein
MSFITIDETTQRRVQLWKNDSYQKIEMIAIFRIASWLIVVSNETRVATFQKATCTPILMIFARWLRVMTTRKKCSSKLPMSYI